MAKKKEVTESGLNEVSAEELLAQIAELEAKNAELEKVKEKFTVSPKELGAVYLRPNGESFDKKYVNENSEVLVQRAKDAGFLPEAEALAKK